MTSDRDAEMLTECLHEIAAAFRLAMASVYRAYPIVRRRVLHGVHDSRVIRAVADIEDAIGLDGQHSDDNKLVIGFVVDASGAGAPCVAFSRSPLLMSKARFRSLQHAAQQASIGDSSFLLSWIDDNDDVAAACDSAGVRRADILEHLRVCAEGVTCSR